MKVMLFIKILFFSILYTVSLTSYSQSKKTSQSLNHISILSQFDSVTNSIVTSKQVDSVKIDRLNRLVDNSRYAKHSIKAINKAREIANKNGDSVFIANTYRILGNYYFYNSKLDSAVFYLLKSKRILTNKNLPILNASIYSALGGVYRKQGNIIKAIRSVLEAKTILDHVDTLSLSQRNKRELLSEKLILFNTLANFYNQMGEFSKSIESYDNAYEHAILLDATKYAGVILSNKGDLLLNNGKITDALKVLKEAKQLKIKGHAQKRSIANTNQNIGLALLKNHQYDLALQSVNEALDYYKSANVSLGIMEAYSIRGRVYYMKKEYSKAIDDCSKSKQIALENNVLETQERVFLCLSESYEAINDYKNSLLNFKQYKRVKDSIFNKKNIKKITQLEMQYKYDKEKELQNLKRITTEKENKTTITMLLLGMLSLALISGLLYWLYSIRQKSNQQLREKNAKISDTLAINEILLRETHHRVKNNLQIISSLLSMQSKFLVDEKSKAIITDSQNRIVSMSLIHQKLYQNDTITGIETKTYFADLLTSLAHSYGIDSNKVKMDIDIENMVLDIDTAIPLGLILNEMISNAFKHGVNREKDVFVFHFYKEADNLIIRIKDNGKGLPKGFELQKTKTYGMKLIQALSQKLKATIVYTNNNGLEIVMKISRFNHTT